MKRFLVAFFIICVVVATSAVTIPIDDDDYNNDYEDSPRTPVKAEPVASPFCPQCLYDHNGNRVNSGCAAQKPPKCDKGDLVSTAVGENFEMCCCNYSNIHL